MQIKLKISNVWCACVALCAMLVSCEEESITVQRGKSPDGVQIENVYGMLRSTNSLAAVVVAGLPEGSDTYTDKLYYRVSRALRSAVSMTASADFSLAEAYNEKYGSSFPALPASNVILTQGGDISISAGERWSGEIEISISANGLEAGTYILPIKVGQPSPDITQIRDVVYYSVNVREISTAKQPLDKEWTTVFYVDVSEVNPLLADYAAMKLTDMKTRKNDTVTLGNIVVMRHVAVGYNAASGRALLSTNADIRYVLEHADKYIRPLQDKGRKVLVSIQGQGSGLGFCNMNDTQITDFVAQTATLVKEYGLDGINLWDENSGYGKAGMPEVNTTSYPKLIKAMREALPEGCLLALTDKGSPTASFHDTSLTGGIAVGDHIDYAWAGYWSYDKIPQYVFPWRSDDKSGHKPIAGLDESKYGNVMYPCYADNSEFIKNLRPINIEMEDGEILEDWMEQYLYDIFLWAQRKRGSNIIVFADLQAIESPAYRTAYEGMLNNYFFNIYMIDIKTLERSKDSYIFLDSFWNENSGHKDW